MRQNPRYVRHAGKRRGTPVIRHRGAEVLGKMLAALPGMPPMLKEIRRQFNIPRVDPWEDISAMLAPGEEIDLELSSSGD